MRVVLPVASMRPVVANAARWECNRRKGKNGDVEETFLAVLRSPRLHFLPLLCSAYRTFDLGQLRVIAHSYYHIILPRHWALRSDRHCWPLQSVQQVTTIPLPELPKWKSFRLPPVSVFFHFPSVILPSPFWLLFRTRNMFSSYELFRPSSDACESVSLCIWKTIIRQR